MEVIVLNNIVTELSIGSVPEDSLEKRRRVDTEAKRSYNNNNVIAGRNGEHIYVPPNRIEGSGFIVQPQAYIIVNEEESEIINGSQKPLMPLHPNVF